MRGQICAARTSKFILPWSRQEKERTHLHRASFTSLLQKIFFVILEQMQQAKVQNTRSQQSYKSTKVQTCKTLFVRWHRNWISLSLPGTLENCKLVEHLQFYNQCNNATGRHRALWKIANSDSNRQPAPSKYDEIFHSTSFYGNQHWSNVEYHLF